MPTDQQAKIFEEFVQLQNPARDRSQGLGLGLAIVRRTAMLLGHPLKLVSIPGRGSMFSLTVPQTRDEDQANPPGHLPLEVETALGVIVIDDEKDVIDAMEQLLHLDGHRIYPGRSVTEAQASYAAALESGDAPVDLIIADYRLGGGVTGLDAIQTLRSVVGRPLPAIIVTGDTSPARLREVNASGALMLHKPIDVDELRKAIAAAISAPVKTSP
ncbi:response regulator [Ochrobactrum sp. C6C9]|uniref:response regulator n=1 Tax=Ochrobactrum sp. C6C9 TaxID=2736662 RepID=UPI003530048B